MRIFRKTKTWLDDFRTLVRFGLDSSTGASYPVLKHHGGCAHGCFDVDFLVINNVWRCFDGSRGGTRSRLYRSLGYGPLKTA